jgi:FkbM family methyltransferase
MNIVRYLLSRMQTLRGKTIVHVGAHYGQEAERYQNMLASRVIWIEASPETFARLEGNIDLVRRKGRGWLGQLFRADKTEHICINALIGDQNDKQMEFNVYNNGGQASSVFKINRALKEYDFLQESGERLVLPLRTLDQALEDSGITPEEVDILVLDTQGAELMCLKGARRILTSVKYIETEVSTKPVYEGGVLLSELETWMNSHGFQRSTMIRRPHMNAIFRKAS